MNRNTQLALGLAASLVTEQLVVAALEPKPKIAAEVESKEDRSKRLKRERDRKYRQNKKLKKAA